MSLKDQRRFYDTSKTSLEEVEAILDLAGGVGYVNEEDLASLTSQHEEAAKTLFGLLRSVSRRAGLPATKRG